MLAASVGRSVDFEEAALDAEARLRQMEFFWMTSHSSRSASLEIS